MLSKRTFIKIPSRETKTKAKTSRKADLRLLKRNNLRYAHGKTIAKTGENKINMAAKRQARSKFTQKCFCWKS